MPNGRESTEETTRRPDVFISATSRGLRSVREVVKLGLISVGCYPIEQEHFAPHGGSIREMVEEKIRASDAVVHIVGICYGAEPSELTPGEPRRSYTQHEYNYARQLGKPVFVFICPEDFPFDNHTSDPDELRALQFQYRASILTGEHKYDEVPTLAAVSLRVRELQLLTHSPREDLSRQRKRWQQKGQLFAVALGIVLVALALIALLLRRQHHEVQKSIITQEGVIREAQTGQRKYYQDLLKGGLQVLSVARDNKTRYPKAFADSAAGGLHNFRAKATEPWAADLRLEAARNEADALHFLGRDNEAEEVFRDVLTGRSGSDHRWSEQVISSYREFLRDELHLTDGEIWRRVLKPASP